MPARHLSIASLTLPLLGLATALVAQAPTPAARDTAKRAAADTAKKLTADTARKPPAPVPSLPAVVVSGQLVGNYQYQAGETQRNANQFLVDRAYLTARAALGHGISLRVTTDVFQGGDQNGWSVRLKYGYLQHDAKLGSWSASSRAGMLHNVVIEHIDTHWPRWFGTSPTDRYAYFSSADVGIAELITFPNKLGELYATVTNGGGFSRRETDRFKDAGVRLSVTPLARKSGLLSSFVVTGWLLEGASASRFAAGGADQVRAIGSGLQKDRHGAFVGLRDHRLTGGFEYASRTDEVEGGANTVTSPRTVRELTGTIRSGFAILRPLALVNEGGRSRVGLIGRYDVVRPGTSASLVDGGERMHLLVAGVLADVTPRLSVALDYQEQIARRNLIPDQKTYFARFNLVF